MRMIEETWLVAIPELSRDRSLAVDVGANRGDWTRLLLSLGFEKVIAIEPDERASTHIERSSRVEVVSAVASVSDAESVNLYLRESPDQNSLLEKHPIGIGVSTDAPVHRVVQVPSVRLSSVCPSGAGFVKIDVEGAECGVLSSCGGQEWQRTVFLVECHDTLADVTVMLSSMGKEVSVIPHPYAGYAHPGHCWAIGKPAA